MKHILGMAKRYLDLKGSRARNLELDYLRLAYAVKELRRRGDDAQGYLLVMSDEIRGRTEAWRSKYQVEDAVLVGVSNHSQDELAMIEEEVIRNKEGMVGGTQGVGAEGRSDATAGARLGERELRRLIEEHETPVREVSNIRQYPFDIRWDFYGIRPDRDQA